MNPIDSKTYRDLTPEEEETFLAENADLHELSLFMDGELSDARREAFLDKLLASEELQAAMESQMALDLVAASAGPMPATSSPKADNVRRFPSRKGFIGGLSVMSVAAGFALVFAMGRSHLEVDVRSTGEQYRSAQAFIGDEVVLSSSAWPGADRTLRVYRSEDSGTSELVFACPGHASCQGRLFGVEGTWTPDAPGNYRIVFLQSLTRSIPASKGELLNDVEEWAGLDDDTETVRVGARGG